MRLSETSLPKASVLILLFYHSLSSFYYNTCEVVYYFYFLFQVHLKEQNTELCSLVCLLHVTYQRKKYNYYLAHTDCTQCPWFFSECTKKEAFSFFKSILEFSQTSSIIAMVMLQEQ